MKELRDETRFPLVPLKHAVNPSRPITYGIVQCGPDFPGGVPYIRPADMEDEEGVTEPENLLRTDPEIAFSYRRSTVRPKDIVLSIGPSFGKVMIVPTDLDGANLTQGTARVAPNADHDSRFIFWSLRSSFCKQQWEARVSGATFRALNLGPLAETLLPDPPHAEQRAIAAFLDRETRRVDRLVAKKRELIERLKEKRTALISRTVTHGLPPAAARAAGLPENPPLKPSALNWLGDIPEHWQPVRLKHLIRLRKGAVKTGPFGSQLQSAEMVDGEIKVYNQRSVIDRDFNGGDNYVSLAKFEELRSFEVFPNDLLVTTRGTIGRCAVLPEGSERGILHPCLMRVQFDPRRVNNHFAEILIQESGRVLEQLELKSNATTIDVIYSESLREIWLALPPLPEQAAIAAYLDLETAKLDALVEKVEEAVERLQEYRTALITAAVTGKIDVTIEFA